MSNNPVVDYMTEQNEINKLLNKRMDILSEALDSLMNIVNKQQNIFDDLVKAIEG